MPSAHSNAECHEYMHGRRLRCRARRLRTYAGCAHSLFPDFHDFVRWRFVRDGQSLRWRCPTEPLSLRRRSVRCGRRSLTTDFAPSTRCDKLPF